MVKMKDKDKLKKLILIIGNLLKIEGNEWLIDEILKTIGEAAPIEEIARHSLIQNIHEYCVEQIIDKQANDFYASFPIDGIKQQLVQDFKKMEHERRRDDFEGFCLSMFQQIEAIVNYLFESNFLKKKLQSDRKSSAFIEWDNEKRIWTRTSKQRLIPFLLLKINPEKNPNSPKYDPSSTTPFFTMDEKSEDAYFDIDGKPVIDFNPYKRSWGFINRFRAVLFYQYFKSELKQMDFDDIYKPGYELYIMRNQNHRESKPTDKQQEIIDSIKGKEGKFFFKFYGFLQDFVTKIEQSILEDQKFLSKLVKFDTEKKADTSKNLREQLNIAIKSKPSKEKGLPKHIMDPAKEIKDIGFIKDIIEGSESSSD
jgi:hypothetical protein